MEAMRCVKLEWAGYPFLWNSCLRLPWPLGATKVGPGILRVVVCSKVRKRSSGTQLIRHLPLVQPPAGSAPSSFMSAQVRILKLERGKKNTTN